MPTNEPATDASTTQTNTEQLAATDQPDVIAQEARAQHISDQQVIDHLREHPDFFLRHPVVLSEAKLPHPSGGTISLVEHQVAILRERNVDMRRRMNELVHTAHTNETLFRKTRLLTLALLDSTSLQELNEVLATHVLVDFNADFVCAHIRGAHTKLDHIRSHVDTLPQANLLNSSKPVCSTLRPEELHSLFPQSEHTTTGSAVLLPINELPGAAQEDNTPNGMLCIGSRNPEHFSPDMDTLFVTYICDVLTKVLSRLL